MLARQSRAAIWLVCVLWIVAVCAVDIATGPDLALSIFYLGAVTISAWHLGWRASLAIVLASGVAWIIADVKAGADYELEGMRYWNALVRTGFFFIVAFVLALLRQTLAHERELARTDSMTGLANARSFYESAARELGRSQRLASPFTIAYLDVDGFKRVNDSRGHMAGDDLLKLIGDALARATRQVDIVGRLGGDEFALLLPDVGADGARVAVERITAIVREAVAGWGVDLSVGVITSVGRPASLQDLVQRADALMYSVKKEGGGSAWYLVHDADAIAPRER